MCLLYLPLYSPKFNPIEEVFSYIKAWIHHHQDEVLIEMDRHPGLCPYKVLWQAVFTAVTVDKVYGWVCNCGYM